MRFKSTIAALASVSATAARPLSGIHFSNGTMTRDYGNGIFTTCGTFVIADDLSVYINPEVFGHEHGPDGSPSCRKNVTIRAGDKVLSAKVQDNCLHCDRDGMEVTMRVFDFFNPDRNVTTMKVDWVLGN